MKNITAIDVVINPNCDISQLVAAVILKAKRDATHGDKQARQWLVTDGIIWMDAIIDIHPEKFIQWASGGNRFRLAKRKRLNPRRWDKYKTVQNLTI